MRITRRRGLFEAVVVLAVFLTPFYGPYYLMFTHDFVPRDSASKYALYYSLIVALSISCLIIILYIKGKFDPQKSWKNNSKIKQISMVVCAPIFIWSLVYTNLTYSVPQVITKLIGFDSIKKDLARKYYSSSKRECNYQLKLLSSDALLFHYCISKRVYDKLPNEEVKVKVIIKETTLGYVVQEVVFVDK